MIDIGDTVRIVCHSTLYGQTTAVEAVERPKTVSTLRRSGTRIAPNRHYYLWMRFPKTKYGERLLAFRDDEVEVVERGEAGRTSAAEDGF